ncbi:MAG: hypothetical protein K8H86_14735 [Ignavibacteriaceae bacterium]|nr:hypothetical protein [Ignavibacteriaceae bacterium]
MKKILSTVLIIFLVSLSYAQVGRDGKEENNTIDKTSRISDRAGGTHNASNIGLFFENRGKLYPRRITQGPSGEFPINSGKHYIYRINPIVGIPGNVVQGRYTTNEEWEAAYGYQNPDLAQIAFSDNPETWHPVYGWPVKDKDGNPIIVSDQDSYCAYNDSNNTIKVLGIQLDQVGYTYGVKFAQNIIFYKYMLSNNGKSDLNNVYFSMYTDLDIGNISGGVPEYDDDKIGFDKEKNFVYYYDSDNYSAEWQDGKVGEMGVAFLRTPEVNGVQLGITDLHYNLYYDDRDIDTIQYGIMSSDPALFNSQFGSAYFHPGNSSNLHFDDPATIPAGGLDLVANLSSGPYTLKRGDTLTFYTAIIAGDDRADLYRSLNEAYRILEFNFEVAKPPATPTLYASAGSSEVTLYWNDVAEASKDKFTGEYDFEGYRLYKSSDKGINWMQIADYDVVNDIGLDRGLQYSYTDDKVVNGFEYWYTITAYDRGGTDLESLESAKGTRTDLKNVKAVIPSSSALGRTPVTAGTVENIGNGKSNYNLIITPADNNEIAGNNYEIGFNFIPKIEKGKLETQVYAVVSDSSKTLPHKYGFIFKTPTIFDIVDINTGDVLKEDNTYIPRAYPGIVYSRNGSVIPGLEIRMFNPNPLAPADSLPAKDDYLSINYAVNIVKNSADTIVNNRPFILGKPQSTPDGVIFTLNPPEVIQSVSRIGGTDNFELTFTVDNQIEVQKGLFIIAIEGNGKDGSGNGFVNLSVKDSAMTLVESLDSLYNLDTFIFNGLKGRVEFTNASPPKAGNAFSVKTVVPIEPNIQDKYRFKIDGAVVDNQVVKNNMNVIRVVPNPYIVSSLYEPEFGELRREPLRQIQFINLPPECTIYIFSVNADRVKTLYHSSSAGTETWDLRSESGRQIAPGVYIYVVKTQDAEYIERFAVIK